MTPTRDTTPSWYREASGSNESTPAITEAAIRREMADAATERDRLATANADAINAGPPLAPPPAAGWANPLNAPSGGG